MDLHLPIGPLKPALGWSRYRDASTVPTSPLVDDIVTALSGPVCVKKEINKKYIALLSVYMFLVCVCVCVWCGVCVWCVCVCV